MHQLNQVQLTLGADLDWRLSRRFSQRLAHELYDKDVIWINIILVPCLSLLHNQTPSQVAATETEILKSTQEEHSDNACGSKNLPTRFCDLGETNDLLVYFHRINATMSPNNEERLLLLSQSLPSGTELQVSIAGHADARGASALNQQLSLAATTNATIVGS